MWVNTRQNFILVACESFNHLDWSYAMIKNIVERGALSGLQTSGPCKAEPYLCEQTGKGVTFSSSSLHADNKQCF